MIIGDNRQAVIENIRTAAEGSDFYAKVELNDPVLDEKETADIVNGFLENRKKPGYKLKSGIACSMADVLTCIINKNTEIVGAEKLSFVDSGVIITSNHFSPLENTVVRHLVKKCLNKKLCIVSQVTNFAMPGIIGFLMNYANTIPLWGEMRYLTRTFIDILNERINKGEAVLIYPEQEMWFNYRKPRPPKRGAYLFAAKLNTPIISCFVEIIDLHEKDTEEFYKIKYRMHILDVLKPDPTLSAKENSQKLCEADYNLKVSAYERIYGKKLDYKFKPDDIAGLIRSGINE